MNALCPTLRDRNLGWEFWPPPHPKQPRGARLRRNKKLRLNILVFRQPNYQETASAVPGCVQVLSLLVAICQQRRSPATPPTTTIARAMPQASQEQLARDRASYAKRRLRKLRDIYPELPSDILDRTSLRSLTYAVRRATRRAGPYQTALKSAPREDRQTTSPRGANASAKEVRSNT